MLKFLNQQMTEAEKNKILTPLDTVNVKTFLNPSYAETPC